MYSRIFAVGCLLALGISLPLAAQKTATAGKTPWGDPDLQGTWTSDDTLGVPMERPVTYGDRLYLTEDELKDREKRVAQSKQRIENPSSDNHSPAKRNWTRRPGAQRLPQAHAVWMRRPCQASSANMRAGLRNRLRRLSSRRMEGYRH
jgi:hypothetical protein